jgi:hypothetical protein
MELIGNETALMVALMTSGLGNHVRMLTVTHPPCEMTATQLETQWVAGSSVGPTQSFEFDFGNTFIDLSKTLLDKDMVTSMDLEETLRGRTSCQGTHGTLEAHKIGETMYKPGPPFAVGDIIMADVGKHGLQGAFVIKLDHPQFQLRLESGATESTSMQEVWMSPRLLWELGNMNNIASDQDNQFSKIQAQVKHRSLRMGSYGVHGDAQWESLHLIKEAMAFAKAVKAHDGEVSTHLGNNRVLTTRMANKQRDKVLTGFQKLGFQLFRQGLVRDCCAFLSQEHGLEWTKGRQHDGNGVLTELGQDQCAISSMLWHLSYMSWFKFNAGSSLYHFRFLERYCRKAQDGVRVFFERPSLTTCQAQPPIIVS